MKKTTGRFESISYVLNDPSNLPHGCLRKIVIRTGKRRKSYIVDWKVLEDELKKEKIKTGDTVTITYNNENVFKLLKLYI